MKRYYFTLMLLVLAISCKEKDISLANQLAGVYDYYESGVIPNPDISGKQPLGDGGITIEASSKDLIKIRINKKSQQVWDFPDCQVIGANNGDKRTYPFYYAVIVDRKTNTQIAQVRDDFPYPSAAVRLRIDFNFVDSKNDRLMLYSIKRNE